MALKKLVNVFKSDFIFYGVVLAFFLCAFVFFWEKRFTLNLILLNETKRNEIIERISVPFGDFLTLLLGIVVEALPFIVLGVAVSVIIQRFVSVKLMSRHLPKNSTLRGFVVSLFGIFMPVCECGNVPVARSLVMKGFSARESITFLLAAPSVNLVTIIVTLEAFNFNRSVAVARVGLTLLIANITAYVVVKFIHSNRIFTKDFKAVCDTNKSDKHDTKSSLSLFRSEMWLIFRMLVIGAAIAAASQVFIPREIITEIGSNLFLSVLAMLILAFVISICSSVDSFFALAYVGTFSLGSILTFLVAGPMVDIKMLALMKTTYTARVLVVITGCVAVMAVIAGVVFSYVW